MGACGGTAVELSNGWLAMDGLIPGTILEGVNRSFNGLLLAAEEPGFFAVLGEKLWVWGAVALGVGLVIFVHELGHFLAAKLFGVKVEKFYVGFDVPINLFGIRLPRSLGRFRWGETEYGIGVIPLGGYVKMLGQDDDPRQAAAERERIRLANENTEEGLEAPEPALDPRSYPAKTVWQRMVIISAGVVMNLITSVLFAAIAFGFGVKYQPAIIGQTIPGFPAWEAGLEPGGRIVSAGGIKDDQKLHFMDMTGEILKASLDNPTAPVSVTVQYGDETRDYDLKTRESTETPKRRLIGIGPPVAAKLNEVITAIPNSAAEDVLTAENRDSEVVAVDGEKLVANPVVGVPLANSIQQIFAVKREQPVTLTLRKDDSEQQVTLPPQHVRGIGLTFSPGKVAGLVEDGPAAKAGVQVGDRIVGFGADGTAASAIDLPGLVYSTEGTIQLKLERGEGDAKQSIDVSITPTVKPFSSTPFSGSSGQVELASLGLSYRPEPIVMSVDPEVTNLETGDRIKRISVIWPDDETREKVELAVGEKTVEKLIEGWEINDQNNFVSLIELFQMLPVGTEVDMKAVRGDQQAVVAAQGKIVEEENYWYERGVAFSGVTLIHKADSLGEAFSLGFRESQRKLGEVFGFLRMLFTGRVGANQIGGPGAIFLMAGSAASIGITKLLLFLTLLSVNLAVLNFLPVPALDGGHMVFLIAEAVRGKPVDEELQAKLTMAGVLALLSLMAFVLINDYLNISSMM